MTPIAQAVTGALLQFVWQGCLVAALLWAALFLLRKHSPNARYLAACAALALLAILPFATAFGLYTPATVSRESAVLTLTIRAVWSGNLPAPQQFIAAAQPWILRLWLLGVTFLSIRLVWTGARIASLRQAATPAEPYLNVVAVRIAQRMGTHRAVRLLISAIPDGPSLAGWIRPVILLPVSTLLNLTPEQLEAVLAHEIAHLARYDDLVNIAQSLIETILFYHPAVWWVSGRIRHERELCCDDLAVRTCGDALCYARALTTLDKLRVRAPRLALGTTDGSLKFRIRRIVGAGNPPTSEIGQAALSGLLALCLTLAAFTIDAHPAHGAPALSRKPQVEYPAAAIANGIQGTVPVNVVVDAAGTVSHARALGGPRELRAAAEQSVAALHLAPGPQRIDVAFQLAAATPADKASEKATLEGTIMGPGGKPLSKATVRLNPVGNPQGRQPLLAVTTVTDASGHFIFEQANPGRYNVRAEHAGYISGLLSLVEPAPGQRIADLRLALIPMAIVSGRVVDEDGDPMEGVTVRRFVFRYSDGQRLPNTLGETKTDDRGEFRMVGVSAGKVFLNFTPVGSSSYGTVGEDYQPRAAVRTKSEESYITTYYPGVTDAAAAVPLTIGPGQDLAGLKVVMKKAPVFHVRGKVVDAPLTGAIRRVGDWQPNSGFVFTPVAKDGSFDFAGLSRGPHTLIVTGDSDEMGMVAVIPVTVGTEDSEITIAVPPPAKLEGIVRIEGTPPPDFSLTSVKVTIATNSWLYYPKDANPAADGSFSIDGIRPRQYSFQVTGLPVGGYRKSATLGGRDVLSSQLDLSGGMAGTRLEIVISMAGGKISGLVTVADGEQLSGTRLALVPDTPMFDKSWLYRRFNADPQGRFELNGISPGKYRLYAVEQLENGDETDPEWLRIHRDRSIPVTVAEHDALQLTLKRASQAQLNDDQKAAGQ